MALTSAQIADGVKTMLTDVSTAFVTYIGESKQLSSNQAAVEWRIRRISISGSLTTEEFPTGGDMGFAHIWNNRASLFGAVAFANNRSVQFDGVNDYAQAADSASLDLAFNQAFTISAWIKTGASGAVQGLICHQENNANAIGQFLSLESNGRITFEHRNSGAARVSVTSTITGFNDGSWHHVVVTHSGSGTAAGFKIYVDNVLQTNSAVTDTLGGSTTIGTGAFNIGGNKAGTGSSFRGNIDEISIWDVEFTAGNVTTLYNSGKPLDLSLESHYASARAWWRMGDNDTFPNLLDTKGGNTAVMTNMTAGDIESAVP